MKSYKSINLIFGIVIISVVFTLASTAGTAMAADKEDAQDLVDKANVTLNAFIRDKNYSWIQDNIGKAKGRSHLSPGSKSGLHLWRLWGDRGPCCEG